MCLCLCDIRPNVRSQAQDLVTPQECPLEMGGFPLDPRFFDREPTRQYWWVTQNARGDRYTGDGGGPYLGWGDAERPTRQHSARAKSCPGRPWKEGDALLPWSPG